MTFTFTYNKQTISAEVINDSFSKTEIFYAGLKQADNSARFQCVFTTALSNFIKQYLNNDIKAEIKEGSQSIFTGYIRKSVSFSKTQVNEPIEIEIVSPSYFLEKTIPNSNAYINQPLSFTIGDLLTKAKVSNRRSLDVLDYVPQILVVNKDETYKSVITDILYEYGYIWDFDDAGYFEVKEIFNQPNTEEITNTFDGNNILDKVTVKAKENEYDSVKATFNNVTELQDALIFHDTTGADQSGAGTCKQPVEPLKYFADKEFNYLDVSNDKGAIVWIESIRNDILKDSVDLTYSMSLTDLDSNSPNFKKSLGNQLCFKGYNRNAVNTYNFTKLDVYGHVWVANAVTEAQSFGTRKTNEITLKYICDKAKAILFAQRLTNWYRFSNNEITLFSKENYPLGSYVKVTESGMGTYYGRIIKKVQKLNTLKITYTIETIEGYTPASIVDKTTLDLGGIRESSLSSILNQANQFTESEISKAEMKASPIYEAVFDSTIIKKSTQGEYTPSLISARGRAITGDDEEEIYVGIWKVYVNEQTEPAYTVESDALSIDITDLLSLSGVQEIQAVKVEFFSRNGLVLIDTEAIPVISGAAAYSIVLQNPFQTYEADENGNVGRRTIITKARVFYGLQELQYLAADGWEYGFITAPEGFEVSINVQNGEISITSIAGDSMPDVGQIEIPVFIHSQTNTEMIEGYEEGGVIYYSGYGENFNGYLEPDANGFYYTYFNFQKLSQNAIKLAQLTTTVNNYWNEITSDLKITEPEKNTLSRLMESLTGEYSFYSSHYQHHLNFAAYSEAYINLKTNVDIVLNYSGSYTFNNLNEKETFNSYFTSYYSARSSLDNEVASTSTNFGGLDKTDQIALKTPKPTDYFVWIGADYTSYGDLTLRTGLVYCWNGTAWTIDNDNGHIFNTMPDVMNAIRESTNDNIPAIALYKQVMALKVVTEEVISVVSQSKVFTTLAGTVSLKADASDLLELSGVVEEKADASDLENKADKTDAIKAQETYYKTGTSKPAFDAAHTSGWGKTKYTSTSVNTKYWYAVKTTLSDNSVIYGTVYEDKEYLNNLITKNTADNAKTTADNAESTANTAAGNASSALSGLNRKRNVFTSEPTVPYYAGDLWLKTESVDIPVFNETTKTTNYVTRNFEVIYYAKVNKTASQSFSPDDWDEGNNLQDAKLKNALTKGTVTQIGGYLNADLIEVNQLFAKEIEATNMHLLGNSSVEGSIKSSSAIFKDDFACPVMEPLSVQTTGFGIDLNIRNENKATIKTKLDTMYNNAHLYAKTFIDGTDLGLYIVNVEITPNDDKYMLEYTQSLISHGLCKRKVWNSNKSDYDYYYAIVFKTPDGYSYRNIYNITDDIVVPPTYDVISGDFHFSYELRAMTVFSNINANMIYSSEGYEYSPLNPKLSTTYGGRWTNRLFSELFNRLNISYPRNIVFEVKNKNNDYIGMLQAVVSKIVGQSAYLISSNLFQITVNETDDFVWLVEDASRLDKPYI